MKKHIDKSCLQGNNVITLIKHFIKHKMKQYKKGGNNYVTAGNDKSRRNYFQRGSGSGGQMLFLSSEIPLLLIPHRDYTFHDDMDSNVHNIPAALSSLSVQHETL